MITQEYLKEILDYNPDTGIFTNKVTRNSRAVKGANLNPNNENGYGRVAINGERYYLHRLAWFYEYGTWPKNQIDHINGISTDNRINNLREVSSQQNSFNRTPLNYTSKYKGVCKENSKWKAQIKINGFSKTIGRFDTEEKLQKHTMKKQNYTKVSLLI